MSQRCDKCGSKFSSISNLNKHLKKKTPCDATFNCINCNKDFSNRTDLNNHMLKVCKVKYKCLVCNKDFTTNSNLKKHARNKCNKKIDEDTEKILNSKINDLENKLMELMAVANIKLKDTNTTTTDTTVNATAINTVNQNQNNISHNSYCHNTNMTNNTYVNNFGEEEIDYITQEMILGYVQNIKTGFHDFLDACYFNEEHPENMAFHLKNEKHNSAYMKKNDQWIICELKHLLHEILYKGRSKYCVAINNDHEYITSHESEEILSKLKKYVELLPRNDSEDKKMRKQPYKDAIGYISSKVIEKKKFADNNRKQDIKRIEDDAKSKIQTELMAVTEPILLKS